MVEFSSTPSPYHVVDANSGRHFSMQTAGTISSCE